MLGYAERHRLKKELLFSRVLFLKQSSFLQETFLLSLGMLVFLSPLFAISNNFQPVVNLLNLFYKGNNLLGVSLIILVFMVHTGLHMVASVFIEMKEEEKDCNFATRFLHRLLLLILLFSSALGWGSLFGYYLKAYEDFFGLNNDIIRAIATLGCLQILLALSGVIVFRFLSILGKKPKEILELTRTILFRLNVLVICLYGVFIQYFTPSLYNFLPSGIVFLILSFLVLQASYSMFISQKALSTEKLKVLAKKQSVLLAIGRNQASFTFRCLLFTLCYIYLHIVL